MQTDDSERREAANVIRSLVMSIVMPREGRGELELGAYGALAELLNLSHRKTGELPRTALMVAEVRSGFRHRHDPPEIIDLGTWQIALARTIREYLEPARPTSAAPSADSTAGTVPHPLSDKQSKRVSE